MPRTQSNAGRHKLRSAFVCAMSLLLIPALGGQTKPNQEPAASQPAARETVAAAYERLGKIEAKVRSREQIALMAVLELCLAIGEADGERGAKLLDAVGYQALPLEGPLPEDPKKPLRRAAFRERVDRCRPFRAGELPADTIQVVGRERLRREFAAAAEWMLPQDLAVVIRATPQAPKTWVKRSCCVVVRLRGRKPTIVGGSLLEALVESAGDS